VNSPERRRRLGEGADMAGGGRPAERERAVETGSGRGGNGGGCGGEMGVWMAGDESGGQRFRGGEPEQAGGGCGCGCGLVEEEEGIGERAEVISRMVDGGDGQGRPYQRGWPRTSYRSSTRRAVLPWCVAK
jgi:hypothetical protein